MFEIVEKSGIGRCLVANQDLGPGQLVLCDAALAFGPKEQIEAKICIVCLNPEDSSRCSDCEIPVCNEIACRSFHKEECEAMFKYFKTYDEWIKLNAVTPIR